MSTSRDRRAMSSGVLAFAAVVGCAPAGAAVLHDQRDMVLNGLWDSGNMAVIGATAAFGGNRDTQSADDFTLANQAEITSVVVDMRSNVTTGAASTPTRGFLIEFFADVDGHPAVAPSHATMTTAFTRLGSFPAGTEPTSVPFLTEDHRHTWEIDLTAASILLDAGTWWLSVAPVNDDTPFGDSYMWVGMKSPYGPAGGNTHRRAGGTHHGNGYPGNAAGATSSSWIETSIGHPSRAHAVSFQLNGNIVPSAGPAALLAAAGGVMCGARRRRAVGKASTPGT